MPSLIRKLFRKSEAPNDGLTQPQREAIVDLLNYCMYADNLVFLAEDRLITDTVAKFNWDPKVPFDQFDVRSLSNARNATESQVYRKQFLASIRDRLGTATVKGQALDLVQELFSRMVRALTKKTLCFKICGRCPNRFRICASGSTRRWCVGFAGRRTNFLESAMNSPCERCVLNGPDPSGWLDIHLVDGTIIRRGTCVFRQRW